MQTGFKRFKLLMIMVAFLSGAADLCFAENGSAQGQDIVLTLTPMARDKKGTDVRNIYSITVDYLPPHGGEETYNVLFYLDGRPGQEFANVTMPYEFVYNFKGQQAGLHEILIELEDVNKMVVARATVTVNVRDNVKDQMRVKVKSRIKARNKPRGEIGLEPAP